MFSRGNLIAHYCILLLNFTRTSLTILPTFLRQTMSDKFLAVPPQGTGGHGRNLSLSAAHRTSGEISRIPSRCISPEKLNHLLKEKFSSGNYDVDVSQNVYQIRAPRRLSELELFR